MFLSLWPLHPSSNLSASDSAASLSPSSKDSCDYTGHTLVDPDHLPISRFVLFITSAKSLLPHVLVF